ncbi:guanosine-3,5-bis(diphosphate) 3-pyrophosphohydrolase [Vibrio parahaemolyticus AQ3810]|nr:guanosine-3,5-bis(diphosphate) 3-pyrophosphohydrolase [Vibrio parahaemolyticus AQ3810]
MYLFDSLKDVAQEYLTEPQIEALRQSYVVARDAHEGQTRSSGEPYIIHPVAVARILAEMRLDIETLQAALLHDVIEDCDVTKEDLEEKFGNTVAELVDGVSKLDKLKFRDRASLNRFFSAECFTQALWQKLRNMTCEFTL